MSDSAPLMSQLRASFSTSPQSSLSKKTTSTTPSVAPVSAITPATPLKTATSKSATPVVRPAISTSDQLDVLDKILTQVEQSQVETIAQIVPQVTLDATDTLNPNQPTLSLKEAESSVSPDIGPIESGAGLQQVEYEPSGELPIEVESYLRKVEADHNQELREVVIADGTTAPSSAHPPVKKPVIVLPITPELEKAGQKKSPRFSVRWLVEWSKKIMKMFTGEVIYQEAE